MRGKKEINIKPRIARFRTTSDHDNSTPVHCVWEITLGCDLRCSHCGSRAGRKRKNELTLSECQEVILHLASLGTREVNLIGGEVYLRKDWVEIVAAVKDAGMRCLIQSGGLNLTEDRLRAAMKVGIDGVGISLDGIGDTHDKLRGVRGSYTRALVAIECAQELGIETSVNTQIARNTISELNELLEELSSRNVKYWQLQLTVPMGNAADNFDLVLQPYEMLTTMPLLAELHDKAHALGVSMVIGNNIGYFGPFEYKWRGFGDTRVHWTGCSASRTVIALESDGTVKGCPSLETTRFAIGDVRQMSLSDIWNHENTKAHYDKNQSPELKGFCGECYYASVCKAGCTWMTSSLFNDQYDNPYCHYRALVLQDRGLREKLEKVEQAGMTPFGVGKFELKRESIDFPSSPSYDRLPTKQIQRRDVELKPFLTLCRNCYHYTDDDEIDCDFCGVDLTESSSAYHNSLHEARTVAASLLSSISQLELELQKIREDQL